MMFPTANSTIIRNEDGEVLGWESTYDDAPDAQDAYWDGPDGGMREPESIAQCIEWGMHAGSGDGVPGLPDTFECYYCAGRFTIDDDGKMTLLDK